VATATVSVRFPGHRRNEPVAPRTCSCAFSQARTLQTARFCRSVSGRCAGSRAWPGFTSESRQRWEQRAKQRTGTKDVPASPLPEPTLPHQRRSARQTCMLAVQKGTHLALGQHKQGGDQTCTGVDRAEQKLMPRTASTAPDWQPDLQAVWPRKKEQPAFGSHSRACAHCRCQCQDQKTKRAIDPLLHRSCSTAPLRT